MQSASLEHWIASGRRAPLAFGGQRFEVFRRLEGAGRPLTLLHGFPTSSWDWAAVLPALAARHRVLAFDFLGFGDSDKPAPHRYDVMEQADLTEALWAGEDVGETVLVAHDYGVSVAQELLARARERRLAAALRGVLFLNGGLYPDLHRARLVQKALLRPVLGPLVARLMTEARFHQSFRALLSPSRQPGEAELHQHWQALTRRDGLRVAPLVIRYIEDRRRHAERWRAALEQAPVPVGFVWGMLDPVSGAHVAERLRARLPAAPRGELADVGHYPQLEAPGEVAAEILRFADALP